MVETNGTLNFIPFVSAVAVARNYAVVGTMPQPSYRQRRLRPARPTTPDHGASLCAKSNTLTATVLPSGPERLGVPVLHRRRRRAAAAVRRREPAGRRRRRRRSAWSPGRSTAAAACAPVSAARCSACPSSPSSTSARDRWRTSSRTARCRLSRRRHMHGAASRHAAAPHVAACGFTSMLVSLHRDPVVEHVVDGAVLLPFARTALSCLRSGSSPLRHRPGEVLVGERRVQPAQLRLLR